MKPAATRVLATLGVIAAMASSACEKSPFEAERAPPQSDPASTAPPRPSGSPMVLDGGIVVERADPVPPAGDLKEDVERFSSLDSCVAQHAVIDPLVGDAVRSIGYDTLLRDACRMLQAIKMKDATPCAAIAASGLQRRCESLLAMSLQDPEKCPWYASSLKKQGRDPTCLAVTTHDARSCAAETEALRSTCEALASGDPSRCGRALGDERATCARDVERSRTLLAGDQDVHEVHDKTPPRAHLDIHGAAGTKDPSVTEADLSANVVGGAVVTAEPIGGAGIELARDTEAALGLPTRADRPHLTTAVLIESGVAKITKLEIAVPKLPPLSCPSTHCALTVTMAKTDPKRGSPLSATIEGTIETPGATYQVKLQIDSFVRDVVGRTALYGGR